MDKKSAVQAAFGDQLTIKSDASLSKYSAVWEATVHGPDGDIDGVVKRTWGSGAHALEAWQRALVAHGIRTVEPLLPAMPVEIDDETQHWVVYPKLSGRAWDGGTDDLAAAGELLGAMHAASTGLGIDDFPGFEWGSGERSSIDEDIEAVTDAAAEHWPNADTSRWVAQLDAFGEETLPAARALSADTPVSLDFRAANLLFDDEGALIFDLENAALAPRTFDLALAVLLFPLEHEGSGGSALSREEWLAFYDGYVKRAPKLSDQERHAWPVALTYMKLEWGTWHLTEGVDTTPSNLGYLEDLLTLDEIERYALP